MRSQKRIDKMIEIVVEKGYRMTAQRKATIRVLLEHEEDQLTSEEIFLLVKGIYPEIGIATVYRSLDLLTEMGIVNKFSFGNGSALFILCREEQIHMHHHLICTVSR